MNNDEIKKQLFVGYFSEKEIELTLQLKNNERIEVRKIELLNESIVMVRCVNEESLVIQLNEISDVFIA